MRGSRHQQLPDRVARRASRLNWESDLPIPVPEKLDDRRPCTVGLTGGLATGKSTVARILDARGIPVFDADASVHELYEPNGAGAAAVANLFGPSILDAEGGVVRATLSEIVLGNADARLRLPCSRPGIALMTSPPF